jgi:large subunit ribosomal protein L24
MQRIRQGDLVEVIAGDDKGMRGEVNRVFPTRHRVVVHGVNIVKKHQRRMPGVQTQTGLIEFEAPIAISNVMVVCKACDKPVRTKARIDPDGRKTRVCVSCEGVLDKD